MAKGHTRRDAVAKANMDEKTARRYLRKAVLPSESAVAHTWKTRRDPYTDVWEEAKVFLEVNQGLEAQSLFEHLQRLHVGRFADGQLRTFQRRVKVWRATEGPPKEVYFAHVYEPGRVSASDFP